jgi:dipeptidyl aminopeptidase/acylaminoacyl peptidase
MSRGAWRRLLPLMLLVLLAACGSGGARYHDRLIIVRDEGLAELSLAKNSEQILIANPPSTVLIEPALSPARDRLAYVLQLTPTVIPGRPVELGMDLYLSGADGGSPTLLLQHSRSNEAIRSPSWFPDGKRLMINVQDLIGAQIVTTIEVLDVETGARTRVLDDGFAPSVAPDGRRMVFLRQDAQLNQSLWIANSDGTDPQQLAGADDGLGSISSPRFSPDGRTLAFGGAQGLAGGSVEAPGPPYAALAGGATGSNLSAAHSANGLPQDIWLLDLESGEKHLLAPIQMDQPSIAWTPDGTSIFAFAGAGLFGIDPKNGEYRRLAEGTFHGQMDWLAAK